MCDGDREQGGEIVEAGASGVVHPIADAAELLQAVRAVARGTRVVAGSPGMRSSCQTLSPRERSILALLADGHTNAEIGRASTSRPRPWSGGWRRSRAS